MSSKSHNNTCDVYQERYLAHQKRKKESLTILTNRKKTKHNKTAIMRLFKTRKSQRVFNSETITTDELNYILEAMLTAPSSCNRKGVSAQIITEREDKEILSGLLVGGVGWVNRADKLILLWADMEAYKNPAEMYNMPYLDAGVMIQTGFLAAEALSIGCCYINPNVREKNKEFFKTRFSNNFFCGALALGKY